MAGNALPLLLAAGAAVMLMGGKKKKTTKTTAGGLPPTFPGMTGGRPGARPSTGKPGTGGTTTPGGTTETPVEELVGYDPNAEGEIIWANGSCEYISVGRDWWSVAGTFFVDQQVQIGETDPHQIALNVAHIALPNCQVTTSATNAFLTDLAKMAQNRLLQA